MTDLVERLRLMGLANPPLREAADEIERLRGVIASDDERLKQAAIRVWGEHIFGCDTPEMLAEKIEFLRTRVAELERELMVIRDSTGYSGSSGIRGMP